MCKFGQTIGEINLKSRVPRNVRSAILAGMATPHKVQYEKSGRTQVCSTEDS
jgi:hypothetical protein